MELCRYHPRYSGKRKPYRTKRFPEGCSECWDAYNRLNALNQLMDLSEQLQLFSYDVDEPVQI